jgi:Asp-tRNA(Asn)/Glu-tRNA(Gln) amidotransferase A subunit family amidase
MPFPVAARRLVACAATVLCLLVTPAAQAAPLDLEALDGPTAVAMMEQGTLTSVALTRAYLDRIEALNKSGPGLNAVTQLNAEALADAAALDAERRRGLVRGPAHGLPVLLKDLIDVEGMYTSAGNHSLRDSFPETDSGVAKKLRENGVVILGKLGLSEYANSFGNQPSGFSNLTGQVVHALDADQNPSGSSSGSGTAGAAALSMLTVGTETSGSIISPSAAQGLVGLRPTVGLVPGYGIAPIRASQDTAGPMDRTVANAAMTLQSIAGKDPINDAYYANYWGELDPETVVPPQPDTVPDYLSALDLDFVKGKRIGWNGTSPQVLEAKAVLEEAGAILVERPVINPGTLPALSGAGEQHMAIDLYYRRLGASAPIQSLAEEIADNEANAHEALKFGNASHVNASLVPWGPGTEYTATFNAVLPQRKAIAWSGIDRMMRNDTPDDPSDDVIAILGAVNNGPLAGYPQVTIPMGYSDTHRRALAVNVHGNAYTERDLLGVAYAIEQGTRHRQPASQVNPSMYRCADTVPAPPYAERGDCNPDHDALRSFAASAPTLPFSLETESAGSLQARMTAGTLTAQQLVRAYLARIARTNADGPAIQAVRAVAEGAVAAAAKLDAERRAGKVRGPLHGIPVLLADVIDAAGLPTTGGSIALQGSRPAADSDIAARLKAAGAIMLGKTNVTELGGAFDANMPEGYSSLGGQVLLPSDTDKTVAGSSAGSAAATAAGLAALTIGTETSTDTAQMIAPSGVAGVVAIKPTVGKVSGEGVLPVARSQDAFGPIARTVADAAAALGALTGEAYELEAGALEGAPVGVVASTAATYPEAVATLRALGATTVTKTVGTPSPNPPGIVLRELERDLDAYLAEAQGDGAGSLAEIVAYNAAHPVEGLKYRQRDLLEAVAVDLSDPATAAAYAADRDAGKAASAALIDGLLGDVDVLAVPSGHALVGIADRAGYPVLTVPAGYGTGAAGRNPIGLTLVAGAGEEEALLAAGHAFEQATQVRLAPSWTNPSMWRCVTGSAFFSPHHCHPGDLLAPALLKR